LGLLLPVFLLRPAGRGTQRDGLHFCLVGMLGSRVAVLAFACERREGEKPLIPIDE